jgi:Thiolase, N-terminal domain
MKALSNPAGDHAIRCAGRKRAKTDFSKLTTCLLIDMKREIVILSGVRTAIGWFGGSLKDAPPSEMAETCVREAVARSGIDVKDLDHIVFGNIIHIDAHDH